MAQSWCTCVNRAVMPRKHHHPTWKSMPMYNQSQSMSGSSHPCDVMEQKTTPWLVREIAQLRLLGRGRSRLAVQMVTVLSAKAVKR
eukprot:4942451-Amphidinium_carterae.1